jgi:hypothetical protein
MQQIRDKRNVNSSAVAPLVEEAGRGAEAPTDVMCRKRLQHGSSRSDRDVVVATDPQYNSPRPDSRWAEKLTYLVSV